MHSTDVFDISLYGHTHAIHIYSLHKVYVITICGFIYGLLLNHFPKYLQRY